MTSLFGLQILREYRDKRHLEEKERFPQRLQQKGKGIMQTVIHTSIPKSPLSTYSHGSLRFIRSYYNIMLRQWFSVALVRCKKRAHILSVEPSRRILQLPSLRIRETNCKQQVVNNYATGLLTGTTLAVEKILVALALVASVTELQVGLPESDFQNYQQYTGR
jgi:hypothetical protein